jgi:hypothetical protein
MAEWVLGPGDAPLKGREVVLETGDVQARADGGILEEIE